jgi:uncharacterized protein (DUF433 family)
VECPTGNLRLTRITRDCRRPDLLGGKLAIRDTRIPISLILECLTSGTTFNDFNEAYGQVLPPAALSEALPVASELTESLYVAA